MISTIQLLILKILSDKEPKAISEINSKINEIRVKPKHVSSLSREIVKLYYKKYINYFDKVNDDKKKYIIITETGQEYYRRLEKDFNEDLRYIENIKLFISS